MIILRKDWLQNLLALHPNESRKDSHHGGTEYYQRSLLRKSLRSRIQELHKMLANGEAVVNE